MIEIPTTIKKPSVDEQIAYVSETRQSLEHWLEVANSNHPESIEETKAEIEICRAIEENLIAVKAYSRKAWPKNGDSVTIKYGTEAKFEWVDAYVISQVKDSQEKDVIAVWCRTYFGTPVLVTRRNNMKVGKEELDG